jgi:hypothetical protein
MAKKPEPSPVSSGRRLSGSVDGRYAAIERACESCVRAVVVMAVEDAALNRAGTTRT